MERYDGLTISQLAQLVVGLAATLFLLPGRMAAELIHEKSPSVYYFLELNGSSVGDTIIFIISVAAWLAAYGLATVLYGDAKEWYTERFSASRKKQ